MSIELNVSGMSCGHCKASVESALKQISGVTNVTVDLAAGQAHVEGERLSDAALVAAVLEAGYNASVRHA